jgi:uncharacterized protein YhaN
MAQIKEEQLKELTKAIETVNAYQLELGKVEIQKHGLLHAFNEENGKLNKIKEDLEQEYGKITIDIKSGEYEIIADDSDSEVVAG